MTKIIPFGASNQGSKRESGFTPSEFRKLDGLYSLGATHKALFDRTVSVDFDAGTAEFGYYTSRYGAAYLKFIIRQVGPKTFMYEVYKDGKGRIAKSGVFAKAFEKLEAEIRALLPNDVSDI